MSNTIEVGPGEHINLCTMRDDYTAEGEALTAANGCVMDLESQVATATAQIATLRESLADAQLNVAIELHVAQLLRDQLRVARDENSDLHAALSKARRGDALHEARLAGVGEALDAALHLTDPHHSRMCGTAHRMVEAVLFERLKTALDSLREAAKQEAQ